MSDPAWQWCTRVNPKNRLKVKCNYCKQIISGGISCFKHHIAGTHSDVAACNGSQEIPLPAYVKHQCQELLDAVKANRIEKDMEDAEEGYGDPNELEESEVTPVATSSARLILKWINLYAIVSSHTFYSLVFRERCVPKAAIQPNNIK
ncbi:hypothetical protein EJ110_NYTH14170 [Nymphaea thermarum]|nr:hypothetical protein EJ110_NYTH14170 [Nymphaea thermarum]